MALREWETLQVVPSNGAGCWVDLAALVDQHDADEVTEEWIGALTLGADAAVRVVLDHLIDIAKTGGDSAVIEALYALDSEACDA